MGLSPTQVVIVLAIALLIFGARRVPEAARGLGRGLHEFRGGLLGEPAAAAPPVTAEPPEAVTDPSNPRTKETAC